MVDCVVGAMGVARCRRRARDPVKADLLISHKMHLDTAPRHAIVCGVARPAIVLIVT